MNFFLLFTKYEMSLIPKKNRAKYWTMDDEKLLVELYPQQGNRKGLSLKLNRTPTAIALKAKELGVRCLRVRPWTPEDDRILLDVYPSDGASKILRSRLNRSIQSIHGRANQLGLSVLKSRLSSICKFSSVPMKENRGFRGYGRITGSYVCNIRGSAKTRHIEAPLLDGSIDNLRYLDSLVTQSCPFSGLPLTFRKFALDRSATASLDRIDSSKGYIRGNVRWVHKDINSMKWWLTDEEFFSFVIDIDNKWNGVSNAI